jgi:hypothetical protein
MNNINYVNPTILLSARVRISSDVGQQIVCLLEEIVHAQSICTTADFRRVSGTSGTAGRSKSSTIVNGVATEALISKLHTSIDISVGLADSLALLDCVTSNIEGLS